MGKDSSCASIVADTLVSLKLHDPSPDSSVKTIMFLVRVKLSQMTLLL